MKLCKFWLIVIEIILICIGLQNANHYKNLSTLNMWKPYNIRVQYLREMYKFRRFCLGMFIALIFTILLV